MVTIHQRQYTAAVILLVSLVVCVPQVQTQQTQLVSITVDPSAPISVDALRASPTTVSFSANLNWNLTCLLQHFNDDMFTANPESIRFGFSVANVFPNFSPSDPLQGTLALSSVSSRTLLMTFGPTVGYLPEWFTEVVTIQFPAPCFVLASTGTSNNTNTNNGTNAVASLSPVRLSTASSNDLIVIVTPVELTFTATNDRSTQEYVSLVACSAIALGSLASGSTGWIGLTALQTFVLMANSSCAEIYTSHDFEAAASIVSIPMFQLLNANNADVFGVSIGICVGCLLIHAAWVTLWQRCCSPSSRRTPGWRAVGRKWFFPGPFLFTSVYLWLSITVTAYRQVVLSDQTFSRPALIFAWLVLAVFLSTLWYDGLKRGFDGHFALYPWHTAFQSSTPVPTVTTIVANSSPEGGGGGGAVVPDANNISSSHDIVTSSAFRFLKHFGRFRSILLPKGRWMNTRGYSIIRGNCDDLSYKFGGVTMIATAALGAVIVNNQDCDWYFGSVVIVETIYLAVFLWMTPFRIPLENIVWFSMKLTLLVIASLHVYWLNHAETPNNKSAVSIRLACTAFIGLCGIFVGYNLVINIVERSIRTRELLARAVMQSDRERRGGEGTRFGTGADNTTGPSPSATFTLGDLELPLMHKESDEEDSELAGLYSAINSRRHEHSVEYNPGRSRWDAAAADASDDVWIRVSTPIRIAGKMAGDAELEEILTIMEMKFGSVMAAPMSESISSGFLPFSSSSSSPSGGGNNSRRKAKEAYQHRMTLVEAQKNVRNMLSRFWGEKSTQNGEAAKPHQHGMHSPQQSNLKSTTSYYSNDELIVHRAPSDASSTKRPNHAFGAQLATEPSRKRAVVKIEPVPHHLSHDQLAFVIEAASGPGSVLDISNVGTAVFVGMRTLREAETAGYSLHRRYLFDTMVSCTVIEDAYPSVK